MKKILRSEYLPVLLLIAVNLVVGTLTLSHYGETWDEQNYYFYADQSLKAYAGLFQPGFIPTFDPTLRYYGPVFTMPAVLLWRAFPGIVISDFQHAINWLAFQAALVTFYLLARRWLDGWASFGATLLLAAQPLLWGHAFINPKDTPFMAGFLACIYSGLKMVDALDNMDSPPPGPERFTTDILRRDLAALRPSTRRLLAVLTAGGILAAAALAFLLNAAWPEIPPAFRDDASAAELTIYLRGLAAQLRGLSFLALFTWLILRWLALARLPFTRAALTGEASAYIRSVWRCLRHPAIFIAGLLLGLSLSIRLLAFAAAALVGLLLFLRHRADFLPALTAYGLVSLPVMYITWPYLWQEPLVRFLVALRVMANFPWPGRTLFDGTYYSPEMLPNHYLPTIWGIQLTEPLLALALLGLLCFMVLAWRRRLGRDLGPVISLWLLLPLSAILLAGPSLYDNARQLYFILPPLFLLAGLALQALFGWIRHKVPRAALLLLAALPGWIGIASLHPYQYIYYNRLVGGTTSVERRFELDYWGLSYRETAAYLNAELSQGARALVIGPEASLWRFTRPDIQVVGEAEAGDLPVPFHLVTLTRNDADLLYFPDAPVIFSVERQGATLSVVKLIEERQP